MNIREEECRLFSKWRKTKKQFVPDGVVSESAYKKSSLKIVLILKEVNDPSGEKFDLRCHLKKGAPNGADTWGNVARWMHAIRNRGAKFDGEIYKRPTSVKCRRDVLKSICAINLKKTPGSACANRESLRSAVEEDKDFIAEQYELYRPDLTICAGKDVDELFLRKVLDHDGVGRKTKNGVIWFQVGKQKCLILRHPNRAPRNLACRVVDAVNELMPA